MGTHQLEINLVTYTKNCKLIYHLYLSNPTCMNIQNILRSPPSDGTSTSVSRIQAADSFSDNFTSTHGKLQTET